MKVKLVLSVIIFITSYYTTYSNIRLPKIFGDNMVLQRGRVITVWGWADVNEKVTVEFNKQTKTINAQGDGKWIVQLAAENAGGPYQLMVKGKNAIAINNVLVGDVWICSGQSNMEWTVRNSNDPANEIQKGMYQNIRHFKVPNNVAAKPKDDVEGGEWKICNPDNVGDFTAVGYFFARELYKNLNVPIGLINTSWGGTHVETWTSQHAFENNEEFKTMIAAMPHLNLDSLAKQKALSMTKRIEQLQGSLPSSADEVKAWKDASFNDATWAHLQVPGNWEQTIGDLDGVVWLRKSFTLTPDKIGKEAVLHLSMIDDSDITFINGVEVGRTISKYNELRIYKIPSHILKKGINVIAVRVEDTGGGGGIHGKSDDVKLSIADATLPLHGEWAYHVESLSNSSTSVGPNSYPTLLFNGMINPLLPFAMKGVLWYQGEANSDRAYQYRKAFPLMIEDWRKQWAIGNFPFYYVQLASFNAGNGNSKTGSTWAELREAQTKTLALPNTGMVVTTDIGERDDIHPKNKQDVGKRLAAMALKQTYGKDIVYTGPMYQSMKVVGNKIILSFSNVGGGLSVKDSNGILKGFEIAGQDQMFYNGKAVIENNHIVVHSENVNQPVAVRFGWTDDASANNLFNKEGFPATPFRTDNWKGITESKKFSIE